MAAVMTAQSYKAKDAADWTPAEVCAFIEQALPGHPCAGRFCHTSGRVLCSLDKEDIRLQARDSEAANILWAELPRFRSAPGRRDLCADCRQIRETAEATTIAIFVKTPRGRTLEIEVVPWDLVGSVKERVAEVEDAPVDRSRLVFRGISLADARSLSSYAVGHGAALLLVPQIRPRTGGTTSSAPRGLLMVPGSQSWTPSPPQLPYLPVVASDVSRHYED